MNRHSNYQPDSWPRSGFAALAMGVGGYMLWPIGQAGLGLAAIASSGLWCGSVQQLNRAIAAWDRAAAHRSVWRKGAKMKREARKMQGTARFSSWDDLKGSTMNQKEGIFLGTLEGKPLYSSTENSVLAVAGPGQGKTTSLAIPFALENPNCAVIIDVKGSLYATTHRARRAMGHRIWVLSPCFEELNEQFGGTVEVQDDGFDPAAHIRIENPGVIDECEQLAGFLIPPGKNASENDEFWRTFSIEILVAFMLLQLEREGRVSLVGLRALLLSDDAELPELIDEMVASTAFSGVLSENGKRLSQVLVNSPKLWSSGLSGACKALRQYDAHGFLGKHVSKAGVDFRRFRDEPTTCYIQIPSDKMGSAAYTAWIGMVISLAMEHIARDGKREQVTFLLDEFQNLPRLDPVLKGLALYREAGIQFIFLVQFLAALASKRLYADSWREILGCEIVTIFGATSDLETLKLVSELAGQRGFQSPGASTDPDRILEAELGMSMNLGEQGAPLIRPSDVRTLPKGKQIIFAENLNAIVCDKRSYLEDRRLRRKADPNPYYRNHK